MSNSLDPDHAGQNVRPDLDPNCLHVYQTKVVTSYVMGLCIIMIHFHSLVVEASDKVECLIQLTKFDSRLEQVGFFLSMIVGPTLK